MQRYRNDLEGEDQRKGPNTVPANKLTEEERTQIVALANSPEFRDLSPKQIVPTLADQGIYVGSESTFYRVLREEGLSNHRSNAKPPKHQAPSELAATGPNQVYSWDITYIKAPVLGTFFYLYLFMDVWSRKIVGWRVEECQSADLAAELITEICVSEKISADQLRLHSDNGQPMKGATMLATLQGLGVIPSFSRPRVSDDNPYSEALFRTVKYRPEYPSRPFESLEEAREWVANFEVWYNTKHLHSGIRFVTPESRHKGEEVEIFKKRQSVYKSAKASHPERWTGACRDWTPVGEVVLNRARVSSATSLKKAA